MTKKEILALLEHQIEHEQYILLQIIELCLSEEKYKNYTDELVKKLGYATVNGCDVKLDDYWNTSELDRHFATYASGIKGVLDTIDGLRRLISEIDASTEGERTT